MANVSGAAYAALEVKFAQDGAPGEFEGYGAVFGNVDGHGDLIVHGAFRDSLAMHKASGSMPHMYVEHGPALGGDPLPVGVWTDMQEDGNGLRVKGKLSALDTDMGRRIHGLLKDGALKGLSIGYRAKRDAIVYGREAGQPKRTLKSLALTEVSLVADPANPLAGVDRVKAAVMSGDLPTLREFEDALREQLGLSRSQAAHVAARGFKSLLTERDAGGAGDNGLKDAIAGVRGLFR